MKRCSGIFIIKNKINEKVYVSASLNISAKYGCLIKKLKNNMYFNENLQKDFNKDGENNFEFSVIEEINFDETKTLKEKLDILKEKEYYYINSYNNENKSYNVSPIKYYDEKIKESIIKVINVDTIAGIYKIQNLINNKEYIGSSKNVNRRLRAHLKHLRENTHFNKYLQNAFNKYGEKNFIFSVIEEVKFEDNMTKEIKAKLLLEREQYYININHNDNNEDLCYNINLKINNNDYITSEQNEEKIEHGNTGKKRTDEEKEKMRQAQIDFWKSFKTEEEYKTYLETRKGLSEDSRKKIGESLKKYYGVNKKKPLSEEARKKMSESRKKMLKEHPMKAPWNKGLRKNTDERVKALAEKKKEYWKEHPDIEPWNKGLTMDNDERVKKISETKLERNKEKREG